MSTVRWGREASTDHSHEDGAGAVDAVLLTPQDPRTTRRRRVPTTHGPATAPELRNTRVTRYIDTIRKHEADVLTGIRNALTGVPWRPPVPAPT